ncbi:DUF4145 domain-containing protein [Lactococcus lactis]|uniref:DUF4145 domain-containing protein n=1 Tax=Lactococcus lactis TaxID=1358 RepID=UPI0015C3F4D0|nr:DUF4145 domain-containing protein [Lactococcus lactis]MCT0077921.1 DUF4145 domain-containing protein [Lactococcus lactis subsp. lactis]MDH5114409.1 DUF4145 domain-containing protein [Lactococcus lactis]QLF90268.1 DUF4145 domain-containing protein [Lactococcus lactis subsp. lactis]
MREKIDVFYKMNGRSLEKEINFPTSCPHCSMTMKPNFYYAYSNDKYDSGSQKIGVLFSCSNEDCGKFFACQFEPYDVRNYSDLRQIELPYSALLGYHLPENLQNISPKFFEIYEEAFEIEKLQKLNTAGMAYRKALEFLVKDFAILRNSSPEDIEFIENNMLGNVISTYFNEFPKIQKLSKASAWIGNDETHYTRKHEDYDINDLKNFINAVALFISADEMVDQAQELLES